jgi:hypothetical protein
MPRNSIDIQRARINSIEQAEKKLRARLIHCLEIKGAESDKLYQMERNISLQSNSWKEAMRAFRTDFLLIQERFCDCLASMKKLEHLGETVSKNTSNRKAQEWVNSCVKELSEVLEGNERWLRMLTQ